MAAYGARHEPWNKVGQETRGARLTQRGRVHGDKRQNGEESYRPGGGGMGVTPGHEKGSDKGDRAPRQGSKRSPPSHCDSHGQGSAEGARRGQGTKHSPGERYRCQCP
uniref:Uncharacterized protein n=1 Tax=Knipowitschia caucasica TaxID=637954 RepID=A0AAV2LSQ5_KNICA